MRPEKAERRLARGRAGLVGERDDPRHLRARCTRAPLDVPTLAQHLRVLRRVDQHAPVDGRVPGEVGDRTHAAVDRGLAGLPGRGSEEAARPAAGHAVAAAEDEALVPQRFGVGARGDEVQRVQARRRQLPSEHQLRAAHRRDQRADRREADRGRRQDGALLVLLGRATVALVARRGEERVALVDAVLVGLVERLHLVQRRAAERLLGEPEALREDGAGRVGVDRQLHGLEQVGEALDAQRFRRRSGEQHDVRERRHGVCPLDVERRLDRPARGRARAGDAVRPRARVVRCGVAQRSPLGEVGIRQGREEGVVEELQVLRGRRIAVRVDEDDGLALAHQAGGVELVNAVRGSDLGRRIAVK